MAEVTIDQLSALKTVFKDKNDSLTIEELTVALEETKVPAELYIDILHEAPSENIIWSQFLDCLLKQNISATTKSLQLQIQSIEDVPHSRVRFV